MINRREVASDVTLKRIIGVLKELGQAICSSMSPFLFPACIGVVNKNRLKYRLEDVAKCVVNNSISIRCSAD